MAESNYEIDALRRKVERLLTAEESQAYQWAEKSEMVINKVLARIIRHHVAGEMRLEFEADHVTSDEYRTELDAVVYYCSKCGTKNFDPRHEWTDADWDKAAHEALMNGANPMARDGTAIIFYQQGGRDKSWSVGCSVGVDNEVTLRAHLAKWVPDAEFIRVEFVEKNTKGKSDG